MTSSSCEVNHQLLNSLPIEAIIDKARYNYSGDSTVMTQIKRLEMSLRPDGWRGNAELDIQYEEEMLTRRLTQREPGDDVSLLGFTNSYAEQKNGSMRQGGQHKLGSQSKLEGVSVYSTMTDEEGSVAESK